MADLTYQMMEADAPLAVVTDNTVLLHCDCGHTLELSLTELRKFIAKVN